MPTCRRKRVVLTEPSEALLQAAKSNPNKEVYYLQQTGEIFETYEFVKPFLFQCLLQLCSPQGLRCEDVILQA